MWTSRLRFEDLVKSFPWLGDDSDALVEVICVEVKFRDECGEELLLDEYTEEYMAPRGSGVRGRYSAHRRVVVKVSHKRWHGS